MSARYYLPMRHMIAKTQYKAIIKKKKKKKKNHPEIEVPKQINEQEYIQKIGDNEYWWNLPINTAKKYSTTSQIQSSGIQKKTCNIVEFSCPADINITKKEEKLSVHVPLVRNLQIMHPNYH